MLIEEEPGKAPKRYNTAQVKPYVEDSEEVAVNYMSSLNKAIANFRDVDDCGEHYSYTNYSSESTAGKSRSRVTHSQTTEHSPPNVNNIIELERPLHENIRTHLTEVIQAGDPRVKGHRMKEAIAAEIRDLVRRDTFKIVICA